MEAILNQSLFLPLCRINATGKLILLNWIFQTQLLLARYILSFLKLPVNRIFTIQEF